MRRGLISGLLCLWMFWVLGPLCPTEAQAQYKSYTFNLEAGYLRLGPGTQLLPNNFAFGLSGGLKSNDHVWFYGKALLSFPGELSLSPNTVILLHLVPVSIRYYFETDSFRPYVGVTNSLQFMFNQTIDNSIYWGPGVTGGMEFRLRRDLFLGFELDAFYMLIFEGGDAEIISLTSQLIFFL